MFLSTTSTRLVNTSKDGDATTSLGSLFQCMINLLMKTFFIISSLNLPWHNLRPFPLVLSLVTWEKRLMATSLQPQPPFLKAKQPPFPQPLLIRLVLYTLHQLHSSSLDTLWHLNVFHVVRGPKLNTVLEVCPHRCTITGARSLLCSCWPHYSS